MGNPISFTKEEIIMCGIVGIIGKDNVATNILESLKRLEYRGYDSAGIATVYKGHLHCHRAEGKLSHLEELLKKHSLNGFIGIGHTRWATHGSPILKNSHPHVTKKVAVVHNGIIENFLELKHVLEEDGIIFETTTDTEVIAHLFSVYLEQGLSLIESAKKMFNILQGAFAVGLIFDGDEKQMIAGCKGGSPLVIGHGDGEMFIGSDSFSLLPLTNRVTYLEDGDWAIINHSGVKIYDLEGQLVLRSTKILNVSSGLIDKGGYKHFMEKEIFQQPEMLSYTFSHYIDASSELIQILEIDFDLSAVSSIKFIGCGTAYYAGMIAKIWTERIIKISVEVDIASEFRYREVFFDKNCLAVFISQSGETADTLAALRYCQKKGIRTLSIVNIQESSIARQSDTTLLTFAGLEVAVASTKVFTCQLGVLLSLIIACARARGVCNREQESHFVRIFQSLPRRVGEVLRLSDSIKEIAMLLSKVENALFIGRGLMFPLALEGALKLKEISYIHAEGFAAGELKHGSMALVDENMPIIALALSNDLFSKTMSNVQELISRQGGIILLSDIQENDVIREGCMANIVMPEIDPLIAPILYTIPLQLLAYHTAVLKGTDVDQPRNLAKSVTVE